MPQKAIDRFTYSRNGGGTVDERCLLRVNIHGVTTQAQCTRYTIDVINVQTRQTWQTSHRYSEFLALRNTLLTHFAKAERKCPGCVNFEKVIKLFEFPSKRYFTSKNNVVINYRKTALRAFLALLASHTFTTSPKCPTCSGVPFTAVRDFLTEEVATATSPTNSVGSGSGSSVERESIRESIQVKDFTTHVPPAKAKVVSSDGVFIRQGSTDSVGTSVKPAPAAPAKKTPKHKAPPQSPDLSLSASDSPKSAEKPVDLPPNESSGTSVSKSTSSLPPSPARVNVNSEQVRRNEDASFVSFSDRSDEGEDNTTKQTSQTQQTRRASSKSRRNKKQGSSKKPFMEPQASMKLSEDDEFGSLNMDFLQSVSIAKE